MTEAADLRSGKTHRGENFPVASRLIEARHRKPIMAFYEFVRTADDVADHPALPPTEKLALLDRLEATLLGETDTEPEGVALRQALEERELAPGHAQDLLKAFRLDVIKRRYRDWDDLMRYCRYSAMPVGRFVLDVHGEPQSSWAASDALCAALQIINHTQDCARDFRDLDRVYLPLELLAAHGAEVKMLDSDAAAPELRRALDDICDRVTDLLRQSRPLSEEVRHGRLALEIAVIQQLAEGLVQTLRGRDPLAQRVHLNAMESMGLTLVGLMRGATHFMPAIPFRLTGASPKKAREIAGTGVAAVGDSAAKASGSSFYAAMRILPPDRRRAIFEIYAFCRAVDDIADAQTGDRDERMKSLERWRADIDALFAGDAPQQLAGLAAAVQQFGLRREDFHAVIDGMEMDVQALICAPPIDTLDLYCDRVASAVGRLCVRIFGMEEEPGDRLAYHLGRALQLTNILRDLDEDGAVGRLYLPSEYLGNAGISATEPKAVLSSPALARACAPLAELAVQHFAKAEAIIAAAPKAVVRAPRIMAEAYRAILDGLLARGWDAPRRPVRLGAGRIARIVIRRLVW